MVVFSYPGPGQLRLVLKIAHETCNLIGHRSLCSWKAHMMLPHKLLVKNFDFAPTLLLVGRLTAYTRMLTYSIQLFDQDLLLTDDVLIQCGGSR